MSKKIAPATKAPKARRTKSAEPTTEAEEAPAKRRIAATKGKAMAKRQKVEETSTVDDEAKPAKQRRTATKQQKVEEADPSTYKYTADQRSTLFETITLVDDYGENVHKLVSEKDSALAVVVDPESPQFAELVVIPNDAGNRCTALVLGGEGTNVRASLYARQYDIVPTTETAIDAWIESWENKVTRRPVKVKKAGAAAGSSGEGAATKGKVRRTTKKSA